MRFRLGMAIGAAAGYLFGTKAGQQRYEQIQQMWGKVRRSEPAQQFERQVKDVAQAAKEEVQHLATGPAQSVTERVKGLLDRDPHDGDQPRAAADAARANRDTEPVSTSTLGGVSTPGGRPSNGSPGEG